MLQDILEAEKQARKLSIEADKYKADAQAEVERKRKQMTEEKLKEAEDYVAALRDEHKNAVKQSMRSAEEATDKKIKAFRKLESEKAEEWVNEIFKRTVSFNK